MTCGHGLKLFTHLPTSKMLPTALMVYTCTTYYLVAHALPDRECSEEVLLILFNGSYQYGG